MEAVKRIALESNRNIDCGFQGHRHQCPPRMWSLYKDSVKSYQFVFVWNHKKRLQKVLSFYRSKKQIPLDSAKGSCNKACSININRICQSCVGIASESGGDQRWCVSTVKRVSLTIFSVYFILFYLHFFIYCKLCSKETSTYSWLGTCSWL